MTRYTNLYTKKSFLTPENLCNIIGTLYRGGEGARRTMFVAVAVPLADTACFYSLLCSMSLEALVSPRIIHF